MPNDWSRISKLITLCERRQNIVPSNYAEGSSLLLKVSNGAPDVATSSVIEREWDYLVIPSDQQTVKTFKHKLLLPDLTLIVRLLLNSRIKVTGI